LYLGNWNLFVIYYLGFEILRELFASNNLRKGVKNSLQFLTFSAHFVSLLRAFLAFFSNFYHFLALLNHVPARLVLPQIAHLAYFTSSE
jgi:hypothetical protein